MIADYFELILKYYDEEKIFSFILVIIGSILMMISLLFLLIIKYKFFKGMAFVFILSGVLFFSIGGYFLELNNQKIIKLKNSAQNKNSSYIIAEQIKTRTSIQILTYSRWLEIIFIVICSGFYFKRTNNINSYWKGVFLALSCIIIICLILNEYSIYSKESYQMLLTQLTN